MLPSLHPSLQTGIYETIETLRGREDAARGFRHQDLACCRGETGRHRSAGPMP